jgi:hypothetical protein
MTRENTKTTKAPICAMQARAETSTLNDLEALRRCRIDFGLRAYPQLGHHCLVLGEASQECAPCGIGESRE